MPPRTEKSPTTVILPRLQARDQIVEDLVCGVFVEDAAVAELDEVVLQRFQLDALGIRHVGDADDAEIGQPGLRAQRRELGTVDGDLVVAFGPGVRERFERRA